MQQYSTMKAWELENDFDKMLGIISDPFWQDSSTTDFLNEMQSWGSAGGLQRQFVLPVDTCSCPDDVLPSLSCLLEVSDASGCSAITEAAAMDTAGSNMPSPKTPVHQGHQPSSLWLLSSCIQPRAELESISLQPSDFALASLEAPSGLTGEGTSPADPGGNSLPTIPATVQLPAAMMHSTGYIVHCPPVKFEAAAALCPAGLLYMGHSDVNTDISCQLDTAVMAPWNDADGCGGMSSEELLQGLPDSFGPQRMGSSDSNASCNIAIAAVPAGMSRDLGDAY